MGEAATVQGHQPAPGVTCTGCKRAVSGFYRDVKGRAWHYACALQAGWRVLKKEDEDVELKKRFEPQLPFMAVRLDTAEDVATAKQYAAGEGGFPDVFKAIVANFDAETRSAPLPTGITHRVVGYLSKKSYGAGSWQDFLRPRCRSAWRSVDPDGSEHLVIEEKWPEQERFWLAFFPTHTQESLL